MGVTRVLVPFWISLSWMAANVEAQGSVEISSPEESIESSLPSLSLPPSSLPTMLPALGTPTGSNPFTKGEANLTGDNSTQTVNFAPGAFPYQIDPISAFMSAAVVMAVQSLREQGKVNPRAIAALLNNSDYYAGMVGAAIAAGTQKGLKMTTNALAARFAPKVVESIAKNRATTYFTNIVSGITFTLSVGAGFEYFSQFWKMACIGAEAQGVKNVHTVTGFLNASVEDRLTVINNLYKYIFMKDVQKRIMNSVLYNRILTFEFIAMNVAMYLGAVTGGLIAERALGKLAPGAARTWARFFTEYFAKVFGGIVFGTAIQFIPDGFRLGVNRQLVSGKLAFEKRSLRRKLEKIEDGIRMRHYPVIEESKGFVDGFAQESSNDPLANDLAGVFRSRDLIVSMEIQRLMILNEPEEAEKEMKEIQSLIETKMRLFEKMSGGSSGLNTFEGAEALGSGRSEDALGRQLHRDLFRDQYQKHYAGIVEAASQASLRHASSFENFFDLVDEMSAQPAQ